MVVTALLVIVASVACFVNAVGAVYVPLDPTLSVKGGHRSYPSIRNGMVRMLVEAWENHLDVTIYPDDVLLNTQFLVYDLVDKHHESMRKSLVSHDGKKKLTVVNMTDDDFESKVKHAVLQMADLVRADESTALNTILKPNFTTTTFDREFHAALGTLGTMKHYYAYKFMLACGIRGVHLMGTEDDWDLLVEKIRTVSRVLEMPPGYSFDRLIRAAEVLAKTRRGIDTRDEWKTIDKKTESFGSGGQTATFFTGLAAAFGDLRIDSKWTEDFVPTHLTFNADIDGSNYTMTLRTDPIVVNGTVSLNSTFILFSMTDCVHGNDVCESASEHVDPAKFIEDKLREAKLEAEAKAACDLNDECNSYLFRWRPEYFDDLQLRHHYMQKAIDCKPLRDECHRLRKWAPEAGISLIYDFVYKRGSNFTMAECVTLDTPENCEHAFITKFTFGLVFYETSLRVNAPVCGQA